MLIKEHAIAVTARSSLKWHGDEIAETALRQRVLVGKESVIRIQTNLMSSVHRTGQHGRPELASHQGRNRFFKEHPDMSAFARSRTLQYRRHTLLVACP